MIYSYQGSYWQYVEFARICIAFPSTYVNSVKVEFDITPELSWSS